MKLLLLWHQNLLITETPNTLYLKLGRHLFLFLTNLHQNGNLIVLPCMVAEVKSAGCFTQLAAWLTKRLHRNYFQVVSDQGYTAGSFSTTTPNDLHVALVQYSQFLMQNYFSYRVPIIIVYFLWPPFYVSPAGPLFISGMERGGNQF